jgi:hypothetical protein
VGETREAVVTEVGLAVPSDTFHLPVCISSQCGHTSKALDFRHLLEKSEEGRARDTASSPCQVSLRTAYSYHILPRLHQGRGRCYPECVQCSTMQSAATVKPGPTAVGAMVAWGAYLVEVEAWVVGVLAQEAATAVMEGTAETLLSGETFQLGRL